MGYNAQDELLVSLALNIYCAVSGRMHVPGTPPSLYYHDRVAEVALETFMSTYPMVTSATSESGVWAGNGLMENDVY